MFWWLSLLFLSVGANRRSIAAVVVISVVSSCGFLFRPAIFFWAQSKLCFLVCRDLGCGGRILFCVRALLHCDGHSRYGVGVHRDPRSYSKTLPEDTFLTGRYSINSPSLRKIFTTGSFFDVSCLSSPVVVSFFDSWFER
jgi:hypothetical protein